MSETTKPSTEGVVGLCRLSYMNVFKPRLNGNNDKVEYSVTLLIPKVKNDFCTDPTGILKKLKAMCDAALANKFKKNIPDDWANPLKDGDKEKNKKTGGPRHPGYWYINASANEDFPPLLIDGARNKVTGGWVSGDWGHVKLNMFGYDAKGNQGVSAGLRAIQFLRHDEPLGGSITTINDFAELEGDAPLEGATTHSQEEGYDVFADIG